MSKEKRNRKQMAEIADRLSECLEVHLRMTAAEATSALGYRNRTMLANVRSGLTLPDPVRLVRLAKLRSPGGKHVDLHWLLTGEGLPLRDTAQRSLSEVRSEVKRAVLGLNQSALEAIIALVPKKPGMR